MRETPKALQAFADYLALGDKRSLEKLLESYQSRPMGGPTRQLSQLKKWSAQHGWQARIAAIAADAAEAARAVEAEHHRAIMTRRYALDHARVEKLDHLADMLAEEMEDDDLRWLKEKKSIVVGREPVIVTGEDGQERMIGSVPQYETFWVQRPNHRWVEQARGLFDDIAKETGGRIQKAELTGKNGGPLSYVVERVVFTDDGDGED